MHVVPVSTCTPLCTWGGERAIHYVDYRSWAQVLRLERRFSGWSTGSQAGAQFPRLERRFPGWSAALYPQNHCTFFHVYDCLPVCTSVFHMHAREPRRSEKCVRSPGSEVTDDWEPLLSGCWAPNLDPLQEQRVLLTTFGSYFMIRGRKYLLWDWIVRQNKFIQEPEAESLLTPPAIDRQVSYPALWTQQHHLVELNSVDSDPGSARWGRHRHAWP